ncbi:hypothetical protein OF850_03110 [Roseococcus sp. MDT2-1-1]|uniref:Secreted protein n=1 Tax=Sabulicella glaciei TaxID=2984948 RepID=A0ABT3NR36_9PROT|nr:hypothetical protein [Roseococcus sp. MDT2-1-1]
MQLALLALPGAAQAGSQSSNSSSNCSDGRCTHRESYTVDDDPYGPRGWVREERWQGNPRRGRERNLRHADAWWDDRRVPRRRRRDDDDDD